RLRIAFRAVGARAERGARADTAAIEMGGAGDRTARLDALGADDALRVTRAGLEGAISFLARAIDAREAARRVALVIAFAGLELARPPAGRIREHDTPLLARAVRKLVNGAVLPEWAIVLIRARVAALVLDAALSVRALCVGARASSPRAKALALTAGRQRAPGSEQQKRQSETVSKATRGQHGGRGRGLGRGAGPRGFGHTTAMRGKLGRTPSLTAPSPFV